MSSPFLPSVIEEEQQVDASEVDLSKILDEYAPEEDHFQEQPSVDVGTDASDAILQEFESTVLSVLDAPAVLVHETQERPEVLVGCSAEHSVVSEEENSRVPNSPELHEIENLEIPATTTAYELEPQAEFDIFNELDQLVREEDELRRSSVYLHEEDSLSASKRKVGAALLVDDSSDSIVPSLSDSSKRVKQ